MTTFDARPQAAIGSRPPAWLSSILVDGRPGACDVVFPFYERTAFEPACVAMARRFVNQTLTSWAAGDLAYDMQLVVSELVTNAMRHGGGAVQLRLLSHGRELACAVTDHSRTAPVAATADVFSEAGRGLRLVDALCAAWGWLADGGSRKQVWALIVG